jgi:hypothetical protein
MKKSEIINKSASLFSPERAFSPDLATRKGLNLKLNLDSLNYNKMSSKSNKRKSIIVIRKKKHRDGSVSVSRERMPQGTTIHETIESVRGSARIKVVKK